MDNNISALVIFSNPIHVRISHSRLNKAIFETNIIKLSKHPKLSYVLIVDNLNNKTSVEILMYLFSKYGKIVDIKLIKINFMEDDNFYTELDDAVNNYYVLN